MYQVTMVAACLQEAGLGRFRGHVTVFPDSNKQAGVFTTTCKQRASTSTPRVLNTNN